MDSIIFLSPEYAWLFLLLLLFLPSLAKQHNRRLKTLFLQLFGLRSMVLICLVIGLMNPSAKSVRIIKSPRFLVGLDATRSVNREDLLKKLDAFQKGLQKSNGENPIALDYFLMGDGTSRLADYDLILKQLQSKAFEGSELVKSVDNQKYKLASDEYPVFIVFTDGNETAMAHDRLEQWIYEDLHWIPVQTNQSDSFYIENLNLPTEVLKGQAIPLSLVSHSLKEGKAKVLISVNQSLERELEIQLKQGLNFTPVILPEREPGTYEILVEVNPGFADEYSSNHSIKRDLKVYEPDKILLIEPANKSSFLKNFLTERGYQFEIKSPDQIQTLSNLEGFAAILIHDAPHKSLPEKFDSMIAEFVMGGGGLGFFGGRNSFGPGGYHRTPIEDVLPIFMPPRSYKKSIALLFVIDSSASMITNDQSLWNDPAKLSQFLRTASPSSMPIHEAKQSTKRLIAELIGVDVAVVYFNNQAKLASPLQTITPENLDSVLMGVDTIKPGGGTEFYPAVKGAMSLLQPGAYNEVKMLFLSDGTPQDIEKVPALIKELREAKIELSTIAFGSGANIPILAAMAKGTGGQAFEAAQISMINLAFEDAVASVFGPAIVEEKRPVSWVKNQTFLREMNFSLPDIDGFVSTTPKKRSQMVWVSESGDPLFTTWSYGLGKSFAWTSDLTEQWSKNYLNWDRFRLLLNSAISTILRKRTASIECMISSKGSEIKLLIRALSSDGQYLEDFQPKAFAGNRRLSFQSLGEGEYLSLFSEPVPGEYTILIEGNLESSRFLQSLPFRVPTGLEGSFHDINEELVRIFKERAPEKLHLDSKELVAKMKSYETKIRPDYSSFGLLFLGLAIFLFCVDVIFRRFGILEEIQESSTEEDKFSRLAKNGLNQARLAFARGDLPEAERFYLNAHRHYQAAGMKDDAKKAWDEFRLKID